MKSHNSFIATLKAQGFRLTRARRAIIDILENESFPITAYDIQGKLLERGIPVNKTTIYREMEFLVEQKVATATQLRDRKTYFEIAGRPHHHHLICQSCDEIINIVFNEEWHRREEALIAAQTGYQIKSHQIELYGTCASCQ